MKHENMITYNTILFLPNFFVALLLGAPRSSGPRFIEPPEPPVSTPVKTIQGKYIKIEKA